MWCICLAIIGMCSQICALPLVLIGVNWPPVGAPGFRSQMSIVLGPPPIHSMMQALCFFFISAAFACSVLVKPMAGRAIAEAPARCCMKCRRLMPEGVCIKRFIEFSRSG